VSYGIQPPRTRTSLEDWALASEQLQQALPPEHLHFLSNLDLSVRVGDYVFVHAGVRPGVPLDQQTEQDLLWIRDDFLTDRRQLGAVIVHGHTPAQRPYKDSRRIGLDTGAYLSGRLTAARFEHDSVEFITTGPRVEAAAAGLIVLHPAEFDAMFPAAEPASSPLAELVEPLTPRESEVLQMLASGLANKEIATRLAISEHTVKFHVASILGKLGAASRTEAVTLGIRRGLVLL